MREGEGGRRRRRNDREGVRKGEGGEVRERERRSEGGRGRQSEGEGEGGVMAGEEI